MKLKYYLRGIGIGVVGTTIIFMILIFIHKNDIDSNKPSLENPESKTVAEMQNDTQEREPEDEDAVSPKEPKGQNTAVKPKTDTKKTGQMQQDESPKTQSEPDQEKKVRLEISGGEYSDVVCRKLAEAGLIDNAASFNKFLVEKDYDNAILPGVYDIPEDSTYEEIAALLTTKAESRE